MARLTTHVLDTAHGTPGAGILLELYRLDTNAPRLLKTAVTNSDGRTDAPLLTQAEGTPGEYEIVFHVGDYFAEKAAVVSSSPFLRRVPVRFFIGDPEGHYHVPLLCSPWSYCTYRGS